MVDEINGNISSSMPEKINISSSSYERTVEASWIHYTYDYDVPAMSGVKLHLPIQCDPQNYEQFLKALKATMEEVGVASRTGVQCFKVANTDIAAYQVEQAGKQACIYFGKDLSDNPQQMRKFCTALNKNMTKHGVNFVDINTLREQCKALGKDLNLLSTDLFVEGAEGRIYITFDGNPEVGYDGILNQYKSGYQVADKRVLNESVQSILKEAKIIPDGLNKDSMEIILRNKDEYKHLFERIGKGERVLGGLSNSYIQFGEGARVRVGTGDISCIQFKVGEGEADNAVKALERIGIKAEKLLSGKILIGGQSLNAYKEIMTDAFPPRAGFEEVNGVKQTIDDLEKNITLSNERVVINTEGLSKENISALDRQMRERHCFADKNGNSWTINREDWDRLKRNVSHTSQLWNNEISIEKNFIETEESVVHFFQKEIPTEKKNILTAVDKLTEQGRVKKIPLYYKGIMEAEGVYGLHIDTSGLEDEYVKSLVDKMNMQGLRASSTKDGIKVIHGKELENALEEARKLNAVKVKGNATQEIVNTEKNIAAVKRPEGNTLGKFFNGEIPVNMVARTELAEVQTAGQTITGLSQLKTPPVTPLPKEVSTVRKVVDVLNMDVSKATYRTMHVATEALTNTSVGRTVANLGNTVSQTARNITRGIAGTKVGQMAAKVAGSGVAKTIGKVAGPAAVAFIAADDRLTAALANGNIYKAGETVIKDVGNLAEGAWGVVSSSEKRKAFADGASYMFENLDEVGESLWDMAKGSGMNIAMTLGAGDKKMRQGIVEKPVLDANGNPVIEDGQVKTEDAYYVAVQENPQEYSIAQRVGSKMMPVGIFKVDEKGKVISSTVNRDNSETGIYSTEVTYYDDKNVTSLNKEFGVDESAFNTSGGILGKWAKDLVDYGDKLTGGDGDAGKKLFGVHDSTMGMPKKKVSSLVYTKPDPNQTETDIRQYTDGKTEVVVRQLVRTEKTEYPNHYKDGVKSCVDVVAKDQYEERTYVLSEQEAERLASCKDNAERQKMITQITAEIDEIREENPNKRICQVSRTEKNQYYREIYDRNPIFNDVGVPGGININEHDAVLAKVENYNNNEVFCQRDGKTVNTSLADADIPVGEFDQLDRDDKGKFVQNKLSFKNHKINGETVTADEQYDYLSEKAVFIHEKNENGEMKVAQMVRVNSNTGVIKRFDAEGNMVDVCVPGSEKHDEIALMIQKDVNVPEFDVEKAKVRLAERKEKEENTGLAATENTETPNETEAAQEKTNENKENTALAATENTETSNETESVNASKLPSITSTLAKNSTKYNSETLTYTTVAGILQQRTA